MFKDVARRTASGKVLRDKAFETANNSKYDGYRRGLASMVYKLFDKKSKLFIKKFKNHKSKTSLISIIFRIVCNFESFIP